MKKFFVLLSAVVALGLGNAKMTLAAIVQGEATQGTLSLSLISDRVGTVDLGSSTGWYLVANNNPDFMDASVLDNILNMKTKKPGFATVKACNSLNSDCINVSITITPTPESGNVLGATTLPNGSLVLDNQTIYSVYKNSKIPFTTYPSFTGLGYSTKNAVSASSANLAESGYMVTTSNASHPYGTWISNGKTIYFVHELGLIPVSNWDIFLSNSGSNTVVLPANKYDLALPLLNIMLNNDPRLQ